MSENAVPIEEMTYEELRAYIVRTRHLALMARFQVASGLGHLSRLDGVDYLPSFATRCLPEPCPHFDSPDAGLNPPVRVPLRLVSPLALAG